MVLQTDRYPGGYQQQSYTEYQEYDGGYSNFHGINTGHTAPYSNYPQLSTYPSGHAPHHQSGWSTGDDYHGNGASHYPGGGIVTPVKPTTGGYGNSYYDNSYSHGNPHQGSLHGHGNPHHGSPQGHGNPHHGSPQRHGHWSPNGHGNSHGIGGGATKLFDKLTHGHNSYGSASPNYGHIPTASGINHGYQKPSWILKGLDDDE